MLLQARKPKISAAYSEKEVLRALCKASFYDFVKTFWPVLSSEKPVWNWHIRYVCNKVQLMMERMFAGNKRAFDFCLNVPPGTTKSTILSIMLPAWAWTRMPEFQFIGASYSGEVAMDLSMKTRNVVRSELYQSLFPEIRWRDDQDTKHYFMNEAGGWRFSVGVKGDVTGRHAHVIVIDDPLNPEESYSDVEIATSNRWIKETLRTRKVSKDKSLTILVMQRLHQDDPTAQFVTGRVFWVCLPAELTKDVRPRKLRSKYKDGLLDPVRMPKEVLEEEEAQGSFYYAAQFLQTPVPRGGAMFEVDKMLVRTDCPENFKALARAWDKAASTDRYSAWTAGVKLGVDRDGGIWVLDVKRFKANTALREGKIIATARRDGKSCRIVLEQEPGSGGKDQAFYGVRNLLGYAVKVVRACKQEGDKANRAEPFSSQVNGGNVYLLKAGWNKDFKDELRYFPASRFKDQTDAASMAFNEVGRPKVRCGVWGRTPVDEHLVRPLARVGLGQMKLRKAQVLSMRS